MNRPKTTLWFWVSPIEIGARSPEESFAHAQERRVALNDHRKRRGILTKGFTIQFEQGLEGLSIPRLTVKANVHSQEFPIKSLGVKIEPFWIGEEARTRLKALAHILSDREEGPHLDPIKEIHHPRAGVGDQQVPLGRLGHLNRTNGLAAHMRNAIAAYGRRRQVRNWERDRKPRTPAPSSFY